MSDPSGALFENRTESGLVKTGVGKAYGVIVNSHTSGTLALLDGTEAAVSASGTLTSSGAMAAASHAVSTLTSSGASVPGTHAVSVFTSSGVVVEGQTITIGSTVYTAKAVPIAAYDVAMGANAQAFLVNLRAAINGTATPVQAYAGTAAHPSVVASASDATTLTVRGRVPGTTLNTVATTETFTNGSWPDTTLGGGTGASDPGVTTGAATVTIGTTVYTIVDALSESYGATAIPYQVLKGASEAIMLDNLKLAINATGTAGTQYSTGTAAHPDVVATTNTDTVQTVRARVPGVTPNTLPTTETMANTAWPDTTLGGGTSTSDPGVTTAAATITIGNRTYTAVIELSETLGAAAIADQVLWVTDEATFLDNLKAAINASGTAGTEYSTGTTPHTQVSATTNTNTTQLVVAKASGVAGNSIATTETLANYAWGAATLASGTGAVARVICPTITFAAGPGFYRFPEAVNFVNGLFATVGGTLNYTLLYN